MNTLQELMAFSSVWLSDPLVRERVRNCFGHGFRKLRQSPNGAGVNGSGDPDRKSLG